ncbi:MAG TPA: hypothetical protein VLF18_01335 [Tahibacter sp.]|uniref:hypothetical protein n=1 Tax=Tahibacter sp. TaxID=2056211 RepID=UPI002CDF8BAC|nr:hypothetical protein [Tahibacter sp.]HSX58817.1 hypothetical protein [Tahibacter sp.]
MSYRSHRRAALDESQPLAHRASHARSCALHVANGLRVQREAVIAAVAKRTGADLHAPADGDALARALDCLEALRLRQLPLDA